MKERKECKVCGFKAIHYLGCSNSAESLKEEGTRYTSDCCDAEIDFKIITEKLKHTTISKISQTCSKCGKPSGGFVNSSLKGE